MKHPVAHIFDFTPESLQDWCQSRGMAAFRAKQILEWVYAKGVCDAVNETVVYSFMALFVVNVVVTAVGLKATAG